MQKTFVCSWRCLINHQWDSNAVAHQEPSGLDILLDKRMGSRSSWFDAVTHGSFVMLLLAVIRTYTLLGKNGYMRKW